MSLNRNYAGVYYITFPSGKEYIGSSKNIANRKRQHEIALKRGNHKNAKLQNAWQKYGQEGLKFRVILVCPKEELIFFEQRCINLFKPKYNICQIAGNCLGVKRSDECRAKQSARVLGTKHSSETRAKISSSLTGRIVPEETRQKLRAQKWNHSETSIEKMRGRVVSIETRAKMAARRIGNPGPRLGQSLPNESRQKISEKLKGRKRSLEAIAKHRATYEARRRSTPSAQT